MRAGVQRRKRSSAPRVLSRLVHCGTVAAAGGDARNAHECRSFVSWTASKLVRLILARGIAERLLATGQNSLYPFPPRNSPRLSD